MTEVRGFIGRVELMAGRGWLLALGAALGLAAVSSISNITTDDQLSGRADTALAIRFTFSKLANSGTVWAGLAVVSGWLIRHPIQAATAGILGCLIALTAHYGSGLMLGMFDSDVWAENRYWFAAALIMGGPLGLLGSLARRATLTGFVARLAVPAGAVLEPFVLGMFTVPALMPVPERLSSTVCAVILLVSGLLASGVVVAKTAKSHREGATV